MVREAVFKITENCPCNCSFCDSKDKFYNILKCKTMPFEQWKEISDKLIANRFRSSSYKRWRAIIRK